MSTERAAGHQISLGRVVAQVIVGNRASENLRSRGFREVKNVGIYQKHTDICKDSYEDKGRHLHSRHLHSFDLPPVGQQVNIVNVGANMTGKSMIQADDLFAGSFWFTLYDQNVARMKQAVKNMDFKDGSGYKDQLTVNILLERRASSVVGMPDYPGTFPDDDGLFCERDEMPKALGGCFVFNIGYTTVQEIDPNVADPGAGFFRPCFSSHKIETKGCHYPKENEPRNDWADKWAEKSYVTKDAGNTFPYTGLGWTYDWQGAEYAPHNPNSAVGMDEYVIIPNGKTRVTWTAIRTPHLHFCCICTSDDCGNFDEYKANSGNCDGVICDVQQEEYSPTQHETFPQHQTPQPQHQFPRQYDPREHQSEAVDDY